MSMKDKVVQKLYKNGCINIISLLIMRALKILVIIFLIYKEKYI